MAAKIAGSNPVAHPGLARDYLSGFWYNGVMIKYRYIFGIGGLILGGITGYIIGYILSFLFYFLAKKLDISFGGTGLMAILAFLFGFLPLIIYYGFPIIGAIKGWKYGNKIGEKKDNSQRVIISFKHKALIIIIVLSFGGVLFWQYYSSPPRFDIATGKYICRDGSFALVERPETFCLDCVTRTTYICGEKFWVREHGGLPGQVIDGWSGPYNRD